MKKELKMKMKAIITICMLIITKVDTVFASTASTTTSTSTITKPIDNLATLFTAIIAGVGGIFIIRYGYEFFNSWKDNDGSTMGTAVKGLVAGAGMVAISAVVTFIRS